jgi:peptidoglycan/LPS O-acetylase OafA/YrhL
VDLFFVLSGFLVSGLFFAEYRHSGRIDVHRFVVRRGFKIWPPYLVYLVVISLWLLWRHYPSQPGGVWTALWPNLLHVQNYFHTPRLHTWSLAVEEHFYIGLAFFFLLLIRIRGVDVFLRYLPVITLVAVAAVASLRHITYLEIGPEQMNLYATHLRFDGLLVGTLIAYGTHFHSEKLAPFLRHPVLLLIAGCGLAAPTLCLSPEASAWSAGLGLVGVYAGFGLIMLGVLHLSPANYRWEWVLSSRPAQLVGQVGFYSYSIYLWHIDLSQTPLRKALYLFDSTPLSSGAVWLFMTAAYVGSAVIFGVIMAHLIEQPSLRLRDRLFPSLAHPTPVSS